MRESWVVLGLLTAIWAAPAVGQPIPTADAARLIEEARRLCEAEQGRLWGRSLCGPMLFVDPATRAAVLDRPAPGSVADGSVHRLILPAGIGIANTSVELAGRRWTMIVWPLPADPTKRAILLMHEAFHSLQPELSWTAGLRGEMGANAHLDSREGRVWMRGELQALAAAIRGGGEVRVAALADALAMRVQRRSVWSSAQEEERGLELNEGLAEWTGIAAALAEPEARAAAVLENLANVERMPSLVRSFAYATGPAWAELLDRARPDWRRSVSAERDLGEAAAGAYGLPVPAPAAAAAQAALARHGGAAIVAEEDERAERVRVREAGWRALVIDGPTVMLPLAAMSISFDPRAVHAFGEHGTVYESLEISDRWGSLTVRDGVALVRPGFDAIVVPAGADPGAGTGPGWRLSLAAGWSLVPDGVRDGSFRVAPAPARRCALIVTDDDVPSGSATAGALFVGEDDLGRRLLTNDVLAVAGGFRAAGVPCVTVADSHGGALDADRLRAAGLELVAAGDEAWRWPFFGIAGDDLALAALVGFHARAGSEGFRPHTINDFVRGLRIGGRESGEVGLLALGLAGAGLAPVLVVGDEGAIAEAREWVPAARAVAVRWHDEHGQTRFLSEEEAPAILHAAARAAAVAATMPAAVPGPLSIEVEAVAAGRAASAARLATARYERLAPLGARPGFAPVVEGARARWQSPDAVSAYLAVVALASSLRPERADEAWDAVSRGFDAYRSGRHDEALAAYAAALALDPEDLATRCRVANVHLARGVAADALAALGPVVGHLDEVADPVMQVVCMLAEARALAALDRPGEARAAFERVLAAADRNGSHAAARRALDALALESGSSPK